MPRPSGEDPRPLRRRADRVPRPLDQGIPERFPGISVALTGGLSNGLNQKIEQQLAAKRMEADLAIFQTIQDFGKWKKAGALLLFKPEGSDAIDPAYKDEDGAFTAVSVNTVVYAYNTDLLPPAEVPKSALDFLKPRFRGRLITTDPTEDDAGLSAFNMIVQKYGWDYMDKYMAQQPAFVTSGHAAVSNAIAAGDKLATFDSTSTTPRLKAAGKPIEPVFSQADRRRCSWSAPRSSRTRRIPTPPSSISPGIWPRSSRAAPAPSRRAPTFPRRRASRRSRPTTSTAAIARSFRTRAASTNCANVSPPTSAGDDCHRINAGLPCASIPSRSGAGAGTLRADIPLLA